jgi:hypothetical protein
MFACPPSLSLPPPPSLFPDKKFPVAEALFCFYNDFYYIDMYIYIHIYRERDREAERGRERQRGRDRETERER